MPLSILLHHFVHTGCLHERKKLRTNEQLDKGTSYRRVHHKDSRPERCLLKKVHPMERNLSRGSLYLRVDSTFHNVHHSERLF